jgi:hypothetical protein
MWREPPSASGDDDSPCQSSFRSRRVRKRVAKPGSRVQLIGTATHAGRSPWVTMTGIRVSAGHLPDARSFGESWPREKDGPRLCVRMPADDSSAAAPNPWKRFRVGETVFVPGR